MGTIPNDGLIRYLDRFNQEKVVLTNPKALAEVLVQKTYDFIKPPQLSKGLGRILGIGVFLAEGQEHKIQRKNLMPAFAFRHVKELYPAFWAKSRELMEALVQESSLLPGVEKTKVVAQNHLRTIDVNDWTSRVSLDIIGIAGLGRDFHALDDPSNKLLQTYQQLFTFDRKAMVFLLLGLIFPSWLVRMLPMKRNNDLLNASKTIRATCRDLIGNAKQDLKENKGKQNILSVALGSGAFSEENLVNQLMTFLLAGHETTSSALAWAIYVLCKYPGVQSRLRAEVRSTLPDPRNSDSAISSNDIDNLPYLNAVCNEVLRLWPPVVLTVRVAAHDTTIVGQHIPKNTTIYVVPWAVNASKELWGDDAGDFVPDRWLSPGKANTGGAENNYAYLTFSHGPRSCIGQSFAKGEFSCLLAAWAWTFETRFADEKYEMEIKSGLTAKPRDLNVNLKVIQT